MSSLTYVQLHLCLVRDGFCTSGVSNPYSSFGPFVPPTPVSVKLLLAGHLWVSLLTPDPLRSLTSSGLVSTFSPLSFPVFFFLLRPSENTGNAPHRQPSLPRLVTSGKALKRCPGSTGGRRGRIETPTAFRPSPGHLYLTALHRHCQEASGIGPGCLPSSFLEKIKRRVRRWTASSL